MQERTTDVKTILKTACIYSSVFPFPCCIYIIHIHINCIGSVPGVACNLSPSVSVKINNNEARTCPYRWAGKWEYDNSLGPLIIKQHPFLGQYGEPFCGDGLQSESPVVPSSLNSTRKARGGNNRL